MQAGSATKPAKEKKAADEDNCIEQLSKAVGVFLDGSSKYGVTDVVDLMYRHLYGAPLQHSKQMWPTTEPLNEIRGVRCVLSSFSVRIVTEQVCDSC